MSEKNDGGLAERGGGGVAQPGGPNTASGGDNRAGRSGDPNRAGGGKSKSAKSAGTTTTPAKKKSNVVSTYGELLPGVRAPVVPGYQYTNRKNQTLGDIQEQNNLGNAAAAGINVGSSGGGAAGTVLNPLKKQVVWNPVKKQYVPVPQPKPVPPNFPATGPIPKPGYVAPFNPLSGIAVPQQPIPLEEATNILQQNTGFVNPGAPYPQPPSYTEEPPLNLPPGATVYNPYTEPAPLPTGNTSTATKTNLDPNWNAPQQPAQQPGGGHNARAGGYAGGGPNVLGGEPGNPETPRQFGGPVAPGQQYTVGENGPETLMMGQQGGGQVIPHNPADRLGGMNPQMMQQWFQMMRQRAQQPRPQMPPQQMPPQQMPQRPPMGQQPPMQGGFGLSQLGQPGVLGQIRQRIG